MLAEIVSPVNRFIGDGAYDGALNAQTVREAFGPDVELIAPSKNAAPGDDAARNAYIEMIPGQGRIAWQKATEYDLRSHGGTLEGRHRPRAPKP